MYRIRFTTEKVYVRMLRESCNDVNFYFVVTLYRVLEKVVYKILLTCKYRLQTHPRGSTQMCTYMIKDWLLELDPIL